MPWPGEDVFQGRQQQQFSVPIRPRNGGRLRHNSEAYTNNRAQPATFIVDNTQQFLNPDMINQQQQQRRRRSSSASSSQQRLPAQIIINNDNGANARNQQYQDDHDEHIEQRRASPPQQQQQQQQRRRRPSSVYVDERGYPLTHVRSSSHARRTPPVDLEDEFEFRYADEVDDLRVGRRVVHVAGGAHHGGRSRTPSWERRRREREEAEEHERHRRAEEEALKRNLDDEAKLKELDAIKRHMAEEEERVRLEKLNELAAIKKKQADEEERRRIEKEIEMKKLEADKAKAARDAEDKKLKDIAVEEYKKKMAADEAKHKREQDEQEDKMVALLMAGNPGTSERDARRFIRRAERAREHGGRASSEDREEGGGAPSSKLVAIGGRTPRPTYIKVHSRYLSTESLDSYGLPWEWESSESDYLIIKQWISEPEQEALFNHTRQLRERARISYPRDKLKNDASQLVIPKEDKKRKKSPIKRTSWFLT